MLSDRVPLTPLFTLLSLVLALTAACGAQSDEKIVDQSHNKVVKIDSGTIEGAVSGDVLSFRGIPYAAPPVGALRWRAPQPVTPWSGARPAIQYGPDCVQKPVGGDVAPTAGEFGEDCLFISVSRPVGMRADARLPVLVWIHGGGYQLNGDRVTFGEMVGTRWPA
jgi:para-nitrobenzyl esterase